MNTEGASLPANLSGLMYRVGTATLESGFALRIPPTVKTGYSR